MKRFQRLLTRLRNLAASRWEEERLREEIAEHLARQTEDNIRAGMTSAEARRQAAIKFGPIEAIRAEYHAERSLPFVEEVLQDARYAARMLRKNLSFTAVAALSLALAIGANATIFSVMKRLLLDRLGVPHAEQLRLLHWHGDTRVAITNLWGVLDDVPGGQGGTEFSYPAYQRLRSGNSVLQGLFAFKNVGSMNATINGNARIVQGELVSGNFFKELQVRPRLGRAIDPGDDRVSAPVVAMVSAGLWQRAFGGSQDLIGRTIRVNMVSVTIIGVTPAGFTGAKSVQTSPDLFLPLGAQPAVEPRGRNGSLIGASSPEVWWLDIMGRAKSGIPDGAAQAALNTSLAAVVRDTLRPGATATIPRLDLLNGARGLFLSKQMFGKPLEVLMAVVFMVLALACCNIASLLLARSTARQSEVSLRLALGAGRIRILRGVLMESLMLSLIGGAAGALLALAASRVLPSLLASPWATSPGAIPIDWTVLAFTAALTVLSGLLFGLAPAWFATRTEIALTLKGSALNATRRRGGVGKAIVAFQVMLSTVLASAALLFIATLVNLTSVNPGFRADHLVVFGIQQPESLYPPPKDLQLLQRIEQRLRTLPGVEAVSLSEVAYISDSMENTSFLPEGQTPDPNKDQSAWNNAVGAHFFRTIGIPMLAGRDFDERDTAGAPRVGIISESLARKAFPGQNPIGKRFLAHFHPEQGKPGVWIQVVGVCGDTRYWSLKQDPGGMFYEPYLQAENLDFGATFEVRTRVLPEAMASSLRRAVQSIDPDLPLVDLRTQEEQIEASMQQERIFATLTASFGVLALALACVGIYGVMAYSVAQRKTEIGVRLALGAIPRQVLAMVLREAMTISLAGVAAGLTLAFLLSPLVQPLLYGLRPHDPLVFAAAGLLLGLVGLAASSVPARRASALDPMKALRRD